MSIHEDGERSGVHNHGHDGVHNGERNGEKPVTLMHDTIQDFDFN